LVPIATDVMANAGSASTVALQADNVVVSFGGVVALKGVTLGVNTGEIVGLAGSNGSGKTTLLNAISGFVATDAGRMHAFGEEITSWSAARRASRGVGRSFQNPIVIPGFGVMQLLQSGLYASDRRTALRLALRPLWANKAEREATRACEDALRLVGLPLSTLNSDLSNLAHGQLKMVDLARALIAQPRLVLMDEPTSGLNDHEISVLAKLVKELRRDGWGVLLVEHNVQFLLGVVDRVIVFDGGAVLAEGQPASTLNKPEVVTAYMGRSTVASRHEAPGSHGGDEPNRSESWRVEL